MEYKRESLIDTIKGISIFLVVFGHFIQYTLISTSTDFYNNTYYKLVYSFHMPLFIFLSGYLITYSIQKRSIYKNLVNKVNGLLVPYLSWSLIPILIFFFVGIIENHKELSISAFIKLLIDNLILYPNIWFLFTLFFIICIFLIAVKLQKKIGISSYFITIILTFFLPFNDIADIYFIKWFYPFFVIGYLSNKYRKQIVSKISKFNHVLFILVLISYVIFMMFWGKADFIYINKMHLFTNDYLKEFSNYLYRYTVGLLGIVLVFYISFYISRFKFVNIFKQIGLYTLDIYLIQRYVVETIYAKVVSHLNLNLNQNSILFILFCVLGATIAVIVSIFISKFIIRKNKIVSDLLFGFSSYSNKNIKKINTQ